MMEVVARVVVMVAVALMVAGTTTKYIPDTETSIPMDPRHLDLDSTCNHFLDGNQC